MHTGQMQFSNFERFVVVVILLLVFAILIQKVLHSINLSQGRTPANVAMEYAAAKSADRGLPAGVSQGSAGMNSARTINGR
jgi:hypothetical protein